MRLQFICLLVAVPLLISCQSLTTGRSPSSTINAENQIDPRFEEFEGGTFESEGQIHAELIGIAKQLMTKMQAKSPTGVMARDAHAKSHGCLKARFDVDPAMLPVDRRVGLFSRSQSYDAWVRFSNNDHLPIRRDNEFDLRGMAIKVMGVEGRKILTGQEDALTQDFLMYGSPIFFIKNNQDYIGFMKGLRDDNAAVALVTQQPVAALKTLRAQVNMSRYTNPANMPYHSAVPIRLGLADDPHRTAMKYRTVPCSGGRHQSPVGKERFNYMRENLKATLAKEDVCFEFQVQLQADPVAMPIEDATVQWKESRSLFGSVASPYLTVAKVMIAGQDFDTPERDRYCEALSMTPWHSLHEHKPLGRTMRMRRDLYHATAEFRRQKNGMTFDEPQKFEIP